VTRVVGETDANGTLLHPQQLIDNRLISPNVILRMPAFDVDLAGLPGFPPEIDFVLFNGTPIGNLTGSNNTWKLNEFTVPINLVHFAQKNSSGAPTPGINTITILIDQLSPPDVNWCTAIDWVELSFTAMYPVVLIHGNNSCPEFFSGELYCDHSKVQSEDQYFITPFLNQGVLVDTSIRYAPDKIDVNGQLFLQLIPPIAASFGVKHLNVIAHSKGGLHMRDFATRIPVEGGQLGILSLTTLSTPHLGSAGADYQLDSQKASILFSDQSLLTALTKVFGKPNNGTSDLRVSEVKKFNEQNFPRLPDYFVVDDEMNVFWRWTVAADGNLDGSTDQSKLPNYVPTIQQNETVGLPPKQNIPGRVKMLEKVYRTLGIVAETSLEPRTVLGVTRLALKEHRRTQFELNDFAVTVESANFMPNLFRPPSFPIFDPANHATISNSIIGARILDALKNLQPQRSP
jgi:hypothetical protein